MGQIRAEHFAKKMGKKLNRIRYGEGITGTTNIAKGFNELGIRTIRGKEWTHSQVHRLIKKCQELGLE